MGDTGSLAIGGAFGTVAILLKAEFLLLLIGGVFVAEAVSVMLQTVGVQVVQADPRPGIRRRAPGLPDGAAAPPLREAGLGGDHGGDPVLDPRHLLRAGGARDAQGPLMLERRGAAAGARGGGHRAGQERRRGAGCCCARTASPVYASDTGARRRATSDGPRRSRAAGAEVELGGHDLARIARAAAVVVAPGVPPEAPPLARPRGAPGVPVLAEVDLGFAALAGTRVRRRSPAPTARPPRPSLVGHLLTAAGLDAP